MKRLKLFLLLALALIFALSPAAAFAAQTGDAAGAEPPVAAEVDDAPAPEDAAPSGGDGDPDAQQDAAASGDAEPQPAKAYVLVTTATQAGWLPLPEEGEVSFPLSQVLPDGTEALNVIHLTPDGVYMEDSTCENHDCVKQGMVTLENRDERILGNMIICLPNQVLLQLMTPEEVMQMAQQMQ